MGRRSAAAAERRPSWASTLSLVFHVVPGSKRILLQCLPASCWWVEAELLIWRLPCSFLTRKSLSSSPFCLLRTFDHGQHGRAIALDAEAFQLLVLRGLQTLTFQNNRGHPAVGRRKFCTKSQCPGAADQQACFARTAHRSVAPAFSCSTQLQLPLRAIRNQHKMCLVSYKAKFSQIATTTPGARTLPEAWKSRTHLGKKG